MIAAVGGHDVEHVVLLKENRQATRVLDELEWIGRSPGTNVTPRQTVNAVVEPAFLLKLGETRRRERKIARADALTAGRFAGAFAVGVLAQVADAGVIPDTAQIRFAIGQARHGLSMREGDQSESRDEEF